jgi:hypothetical protein
LAASQNRFGTRVRDAYALTAAPPEEEHCRRPSPRSITRSLSPTAILDLFVDRADREAA